MATTQPASYGDDSVVGHTDADMDADMDTALWGELRSYIDLAMIYAKLPLAPFFRLRQVCKEWNRLASDRQFLERTFKPPVASPFFFVSPREFGDRLFTCQGSSWSSMPLPRVKCEVSGLLFERSSRDSDRIRIFDLHTRVFHTVPPIPATMQPSDEEDYFRRPLIGMTVDTTLIPHNFRLILADEVIGTCIYDSKSVAWTQKPSMYENSLDADPMPSCVNHDQFLYIKVPGGEETTFDLHEYDLERDVWSLRSPDAVELPAQEFRDIGLWQERLFVFGLKFGSGVAVGVAVWEIDHSLKEPWTLYDSIPGELCAWIVSGKDSKLKHIQSKFCNQHVLLYNYVASEEKAVLYNLDRKTWEKVTLPALPGRHHQQLPQ